MRKLALALISAGAVSCSCIDVDVCEKATAPCVSFDVSLCDLIVACLEDTCEDDGDCYQNCADLAEVTFEDSRWQDALFAYKNVESCP